MAVAESVMVLSKDPSTQVGGVALDEDLGVLCVGYNGFARGVKDTPERLNDRSIKYPLTVHAEGNIVAQAARKGIRLEGATVVVTSLYPCSNCASLMVQAGVKRIITSRPDNERWVDSNKLADIVFTEAGIEVIEVEKVDGKWQLTASQKQRDHVKWNSRFREDPTIGFGASSD